MQPGRTRVARQAVVTVGASLVLVGTFLPWLRSGQRRRSSYELYAVLRRLGSLDDGLTRAALRVWPLVPLLVTMATIVVWSGRLRSGALIAAVTALYVGLAAVIAWRSPLPIGFGIPVSLVGAFVMLTGAASLIHESKTNRTTSPAP